MGPLEGFKIVEFAGIGPGPFCAMMLADMGADVVRVDRPADRGQAGPDLLNRGRRSIRIDLKRPGGIDVARRLLADADGLIEGFRPGVMERLQLGPTAVLEHNPKLVYGRMTGFGQDGPLAGAAGHDIDYIALSGVLGAIGRAGERPVPPLNLVGDFGGGGMLLAFGMVCGLLEASRSGRGQVVDAAMVDGSALLSTMMWSMAATGMWKLDEKAANLLDGAAPFYDTYLTADDRYMAVGAIEPEFFTELVGGLGLEVSELPDQYDRRSWPEIRRRFTERFAQRSRDEWTSIFDGRDACVTPVLTFAEAPLHEHNAARATFVDVAGVQQPAPGPRFSLTPASRPTPPPTAGQHTAEIFAELGFDAAAIDTLVQERSVR